MQFNKDKALISLICILDKILNPKKRTSNLKGNGQNIWTGNLQKKDDQMTHEQMKSCLISLIIIEM